MNVKVYRNLHKKCYSLIDRATGKVALRQFHVVLRNAVFKVSEAGRQRVLKTGRKNVHAFVCGELAPAPFGFPDLTPREAYYNPRAVTTFIDKETKTPVEKAAMVLLTPTTIYYWENAY